MVWKKRRVGEEEDCPAEVMHKPKWNGTGIFFFSGGIGVVEIVFCCLVVF
jgi:hypothetical protein